MVEQKEKYDKLLEQYTRYSKDRIYTFELTKCCGYMELLYIHRIDSCLGLYKLVSLQMATNDIKRLFLKRQDGTEVDIPLSDHMPLNTFINEEITQHGLRSIYGLDVPVVYRLYYDDGHCYPHECNKK